MTGPGTLDEAVRQLAPADRRHPGSRRCREALWAMYPPSRAIPRRHLVRLAQAALERLTASADEEERDAVDADR